MRLAMLLAFVLTASAMAEPVQIVEGAGSFIIEGGEGRKEKEITIFYYRPTTFTQDSRVLIVVPGAGRNGWSYRDAWMNAADEHGVLILSPHYPEASYPEFWSYNLAGMVKNVEVNSSRTAITGFDVASNPEDWIFSDFDRLFEQVKGHMGLRANQYDMFGHSAGGQVLHRLALFRPNSKARRIVSANSGWYTVPTLEEEFPYGVAEMLTPDKLLSAFSVKLVLLLGELDNRNETRGHLVRNPQIDIQGLSRLERGTHFFTKATETADRLNAEIDWELKVVPGVGHDYRLMSNAAADYLY